MTCNWWRRILHHRWRQHDWAFLRRLERAHGRNETLARARHLMGLSEHWRCECASELATTINGHWLDRKERP